MKRSKKHLYLVAECKPTHKKSYGSLLLGLGLITLITIVWILK